MELHTELPMDRLSKTFKDALKITRRIGVDYIWIDSLCIIQDSSADWTAESCLMGDIYARSHCNIAAAFAPDGTHGCFVQRDSDQLKATTVTIDWTPNPGEYFLAQWPDALVGALGEALGKRAWDCQERFLSPRILYFNSNQIHWECSELFASEAFPLGVPSQLSDPIGVLTKSLDPEHIRIPWLKGPEVPSDLKALFIWNRVLQDYVKKRLTFPTDKLVAISGLAARLQCHFKCGYFAGLWESNFVTQLLWRVQDYPERGVCRRKEPYIAPTWSWASMEGRVFIDTNITTFLARARPRLGSVVEVIEVHIDLADPDKSFGHVTGGFLRLRGPIARPRFQIQPMISTLSTPDLVNEEVKFGRAALDDRALYEHDDPPGSAATKSAHDDLWYLPLQTNF